MSGMGAPWGVASASGMPNGVKPPDIVYVLKDYKASVFKKRGRGEEKNVHKNNNNKKKTKSINQRMENNFWKKVERKEEKE